MKRLISVPPSADRVVSTIHHLCGDQKMNQIALMGTLILGALSLALPAFGSSHREAPLIAQDPEVDNTDVYAFVSPDQPNTVTLIANYYPAEEPNGGPNFYGFSSRASYRIHIDNDADCTPDIEYVLSFTTTTANPGTFLYNTGPVTSLNDADWNVRQSYSVHRIDDTGNQTLGSGLLVPPVNIGPASTPNYEALAASAVYDLPGGTRVFAGQRDDPFFVDLGAVFDLLTIRPGAPGNAGGGKDGLDGYNCQTIAIQIPISMLTNDGTTPQKPDDPAAVIGVWASAARPEVLTLSSDGNHVSGTNMVQVSRLGLPLVNEVVIPLGFKDLWNVSQPGADAQFLSYVQNPELAGLLNALYGVNVPPTPRNDLVAVFLTGVAGLNQPPNVTPCEQIRLNMAIPPNPAPSRFGVLAGDLAGFPNGRRLADDVVDIELRAVAGVLVPGFNISPNNLLGDGTDLNDVSFLPAFPYVGTPHQGFEHTHDHLDEQP